MHIYNRERRRLKKLRKDRVRQLSTANETATKRHKHKHKCGEELCKHRKHKKRRKHRKHHHRTGSDAVDGQSEELQELDDQNGTESDLPIDDEQDSVDSLQTVRHRSSSAKNSLRALAAGNVSANHSKTKVQWSTDEDIASSITEDSSGSSYVSCKWDFFYIEMSLCLKPHTWLVIVIYNFAKKNTCYF